VLGIGEVLVAVMCEIGSMCGDFAVTAAVSNLLIRRDIRTLSWPACQALTCQDVAQQCAAVADVWRPLKAKSGQDTSSAPLVSSARTEDLHIEATHPVLHCLVSLGRDDQG
jgi:hypothetical protein